MTRTLTTIFDGWLNGFGEVGKKQPGLLKDENIPDF